MRIGSPARLPYESDAFDAVFAYCYLDFLPEVEERVASEELERVLKPGGRLLASYLGRPRHLIERSTVFFLTKFPLVASGLRVIEPSTMLRQVGFRGLEAFSLPQKGVPVFLVYAEKAAEKPMREGGGAGVSPR